MIMTYAELLGILSCLVLLFFCAGNLGLGLLKNLLLYAYWRPVFPCLHLWERTAFRRSRNLQF